MLIIQPTPHAVLRTEGGCCCRCYCCLCLLGLVWPFHQVLKAVTAGLFMNAAQYDHTEYDPRAANDSGSNVYRLIRHMQPGEPTGSRTDAHSYLLHQS